MERPRRILTSSSMSSTTYLNARHVQQTVASAAALEADNERDMRIAKGLCRYCYYIRSTMGGCAMTTQPCGLCGEPQHYASTATDELCASCAKEHSLCKRCGGDREMRTLRRKWPDATPDAKQES